MNSSNLLISQRRLNQKLCLMLCRPNTGKTVLSSAIVDELRCFEGTKTAFAFLTYQEAKTSALSITHSLIFQLAERDENLMAIICGSMAEDLNNDIIATSKLLSSLIRYVGSVYLVIDGVDEISELERGILVKNLLKLAKVCNQLKIILSSRSEADIMELLNNTSVVIRVHDHNEDSIKDYIHERSQHMFDSRNSFHRQKPRSGRFYCRYQVVQKACSSMLGSSWI